tara:strand:+ start:1438 stop:4800 length:3363 start_codon:yes stop_codon:yes gene_type:complete
MELLQEKRIPLKKNNVYINNEIKTKYNLHENNNNSLDDFIKILSERYNLILTKEKNSIEGSVKLEETINLIKISEEELNKILDKNKFMIPVKVDLDNLNIDNNKKVSDVTKKIPTKKIVKNVKNDFENGILSSDIDDIDDILKKYDYYNNDDSLFKVDIAESFIHNNKIGYLKDIKMKLLKYLESREKSDFEKESSCEQSDKESGFHPLIHQDIVKQYLNAYTPYRGLLLYHGLGSGKTCTSIGIIESMKSSNLKIFILTPASLQKNYKTQLQFCGSEIFRNNNRWEYVTFPQDNTKEKFIKQVRYLTKLPLKYLNKKNGVYLLKKKIGNISDENVEYNNFGNVNDNELSEQIKVMIENRFNFINYNGISMKMWNNKYKKNVKDFNPFNNSLIIVDEAHNFVSRIVNKLNIKKKSVSTEIYDNIISAENCKVVLLTGTPLINYPSELGVLFNLISGTYNVIELKCTRPDNDDSKLKLSEFKKILNDVITIDYINYIIKTNTLQIIKNPYGFVNTPNDKIIYDFDNTITTEELKSEIVKKLKQNGYKIVLLEDKGIKKYNKFPDTEEEFNKLFIDSRTNKLTNKRYFQNKITGLVSYIGDKKELMPKIEYPKKEDLDKSQYKDEEIFIEELEMSEFLMSEYSKARSRERDMDNNKKKGKDNQTSSYKIYSRAACNFVFPEGYERPIPSKSLHDNMDEDDLELLDEKEMITMNDGKYDDSDIIKQKKNSNSKKIFKEKIEKLLSDLTKDAHNLFESDLIKFTKNIINTKIDISEKTSSVERNNLKRYSPKFYKILSNIFDEENDGLHLLYSNFRTLEGIGILKILLDYYGYSEFKLIKNDTGLEKEYSIDINSNIYYNNNNFVDTENAYEDNKITTLNGRKFYALYTGKENEEEKEIIRNVYNGNIDKLPDSLKTDIINYFFDGDYSNAINKKNMEGNIIKLLIISSSGAEGIDLKNVQYVHITEPYWHPVRISQVIGRAKRICSHTDLPEEKRNVKVFMYLLKYDKELLKKKEDMYTQLINLDTERGTKNVITTDENLYKIMVNKKKIMQEFLTAIKEASVDCFINYENNKKCLSFPIQSNENKKYITKIDYTKDAVKTLQKTSQLQVDSSKAFGVDDESK